MKQDENLIKLITEIQNKASLWDASVNMDSARAVRTKKKEDMDLARESLAKQDASYHLRDEVIWLVRKYWSAESSTP